MVAISTPKISSLYKRIVADFPGIHFVKGDNFHWSPEKKSIFHPPISSTESLAHLLHEVGHAQLEHSSYARDITLIDMERQAWEYAVDTLAPRYALALTMNDDIVDESLASYRQWLNARSTCPHCQAIGVEKTAETYYCLVCHGSWTVNEARTCQLRRYKK